MTGIERIQLAFASYPKLFAGYLMAGDGGMEQTFHYAAALVEGGVNLLEIGVPFSDPIADGPVIQAAVERSLSEGTHLEAVLALVQRIRATYATVPVILFSYLNPLLSALNQADFWLKVKRAGVDGLLIVDCPFDLLKDVQGACSQHGVALIPVITPATPISRVQQIDAATQGFLYYACRKGTTGIKTALPMGFADKIQEIRSVAHNPIVAGFGISTDAMAEQVCKSTDGFVVGSLFVKAIGSGVAPLELKEIAMSLSR